MTDSVAFHTATNPNGVGLFSNDTTVVTLPPLGLRFLVSFTCVFSMLGASLIVLVYSLLPKVRTKPALILVHISLMDFLTAMANLTGVVLVITGNNRGPGCVVQASLAMYGTLSSVLWTSGLAVYVFAAVLFGERKVTRDHVLHCLCVLCYGLPLIMTLWFSLTGKLGPDPIGGPSWCSLVLHDGAGRRLPFNTLFGNDVWMYVTIVMVVVLFAPMHCYLKYSHYDDNDSGLEPLPLLSAELKLIGVPVVFILLRIWSLLLGFVDVEIGYDSDTTATTVLLYMSVHKQIPGHTPLSHRPVRRCLMKTYTDVQKDTDSSRGERVLCLHHNDGEDEAPHPEENEHHRYHEQLQFNGHH